MRLVSGKVFDVAVDMRKDSPTYGKWEGVVLSAENKCQFLFFADSHKDSLFCSMLQSFATNAMTSTTQTMKAASCGTIPPSESSDQRSKAASSLIRLKSP